MHMGGCGRVRSSSSPHWAEGAGQASWGWQERSSGQSDRSRALPLRPWRLPNSTRTSSNGKSCAPSIQICYVRLHLGTWSCSWSSSLRYEVASLTATLTFLRAWGNGVGVGVGVGVPQTWDRACCPRPRAGTPPPGFNSTSNRRSLTMHAGHSAASRAHWSRRSENAFPTNCSANPADPCCARCWARYGQPSPERYQSYDVGGAHLGVDPANVHLPAGSPSD